jgi:hypothetical protein
MPDQIIRILQIYCTHCNLATPKSNARCIHCGKPHVSGPVLATKLNDQSQRLAVASRL